MTTQMLSCRTQGSRVRPNQFNFNHFLWLHIKFQAYYKITFVYFHTIMYFWVNFIKNGIEESYSAQNLYTPLPLLLPFHTYIVHTYVTCPYLYYMILPIKSYHVACKIGICNILLCNLMMSQINLTSHFYNNICLNLILIYTDKS